MSWAACASLHYIRFSPVLMTIFQTQLEAIFNVPLPPDAQSNMVKTMMEAVSVYDYARLSSNTWMYVSGIACNFCKRFLELSEHVE